MQEETKLRPVEQLHKTKSKYDVVYKGKVVRLLLDSCSCGVHAKWAIELKVEDCVPDFMVQMMPDSDKNKTIEKVLEEWHFHPKWWEKHLLRHTMEGQLKKWVKKTHKHFVELSKSEGNLARLQEML